jgi:hypothetical protein
MPACSPHCGVNGISVGALGVDDGGGVRYLRSGAEGGDLGCGDAEVEGQLGRGGGGAEEDELIVGGVHGGAGFGAGGAGVGDGAVDLVVLEARAEDDWVLGRGEELVESDVDERCVEGDGD